MDSIAMVSQSVEALNQVLKNAQSKSINAAENLMKVNVQMAVGKELNKGQSLDISV